MISIDLLKIAIDSIKKMSDNEERWSKTFNEMLDGRFVPKIYEDAYHAICSMVEIAYNDEPGQYGSVFSWWIWETNFGETAKMWDKNEKLIPLKTIEDLYNYYCKYTLKDNNE